MKNNKIKKSSFHLLLSNFKGRLVVKLCFLAKQISDKSQLLHLGDFGVHTIAPNSIMAWL